MMTSSSLYACLSTITTCVLLKMVSYATLAAFAVVLTIVYLTFKNKKIQAYWIKALFPIG